MTWDEPLAKGSSLLEESEEMRLEGRSEPHLFIPLAPHG